MTDNNNTPTSVPILKALQKRGFGTTQFVRDQQISDFEVFRQFTEWTGTIAAVQLTNLKRGLMGLLGAKKLTASIDQTSKQIQVTYQLAPECATSYPLDDLRKSRANDVALACLGKGWTVIVAPPREESSDDASRPTTVSSKASKRKRIRGRTKSRSR